MAAHAQVSLPVLGRVLERAARLGVTRVCLKVERSGDFRVPCCVPIRLGPPGVWPSRTLEVGKEGVTLVDGASVRVVHPAIVPARLVYAGAVGCPPTLAGGRRLRSQLGLDAAGISAATRAFVGK